MPYYYDPFTLTKKSYYQCHDCKEYHRSHKHFFKKFYSRCSDGSYKWVWLCTRSPGYCAQRASADRYAHWYDIVHASEEEEEENAVPFQPQKLEWVDHINKYMRIAQELSATPEEVEAVRAKNLSPFTLPDNYAGGDAFNFPWEHGEDYDYEEQPDVPQVPVQEDVQVPLSWNPLRDRLGRAFEEIKKPNSSHAHWCSSSLCRCLQHRVLQL